MDIATRCPCLPGRRSCVSPLGNITTSVLTDTAGHISVYVAYIVARDDASMTELTAGHTGCHASVRGVLLRRRRIPDDLLLFAGVLRHSFSLCST